MLILFASILAFANARPAYFDQRQEGEFNLRANIENVLFVIAIPPKLPSSLFDILLMADKGNLRKASLQDRSDSHTMEAFVEPNTPYQVEIGTEERQADSDGANIEKIEVVIAGRRRLDPDHDVQAEETGDEMKLLGATEQCGPDRERDPVTLTCRSVVVEEPESSETESIEKKDEKVETQPIPQEVAS